jgi:hypothetical protein
MSLYRFSSGSKLNLQRSLFEPTGAEGSNFPKVSSNNENKPGNSFRCPAELSNNINNKIPMAILGGKRQKLENSNNPSIKFAQVVKKAASQSFTQRHPVIARLLSGFVGVVAFAANNVVAPFLIGAAIVSKACGSGELAKRIGALPFMKYLAGYLADEMEKDNMSSGEMAVMAIPFFGPVHMGVNAAKKAFDKMQNRH